MKVFLDLLVMGTGWAFVDNAGTNNPIDTQANSFIINK
jgi:hypothetical protein